MDRREERKIRRKRLHDIKNSLNQLESHFLSPVDLKAHGVQQIPLSLEERTADACRFFKPYEASIQPPEVDTLAVDYPIFEGQDDDDVDDQRFVNASALGRYLNEYFEHCIVSDDEPIGSYYKDFGDFRFGPLLSTSLKEPRWQVHAAWDLAAQPPLPHMKVLMFSGVVGDDQHLFRAELLVIIDVMFRRLNVKSLRSHTVAPVLLFSVLGMHHVRVLEAFFDGKKLIISRTGLYNLKECDHERLILFSRWWLGYASAKSTMDL